MQEYLFIDNRKLKIIFRFEKQTVRYVSIVFMFSCSDVQLILNFLT